MSDPDEELARRLQAEEFQQYRQPQPASAAAVAAREPSRSSFFAPIPTSSPSAAATAARSPAYGQQQLPAQPQPPQQPSVVAVRPGSSTLVLLRHVATRRQLNDVLKLCVTPERLVYFELANKPGKRLMVHADGVTSFGFTTSEVCLFEPDVLPNGCMTFRSVEFRDAINSQGTSGWYLSIDPASGSMVGDAGKSASAAWMLTDATRGTAPLAQSPQARPAVGAGASGVAAPAPAIGQQVVDPRQDTISWLASGEGQNWLAERPYLQQLYRDGHLTKLLYRADWATAAERWTPSYVDRIPYNPAHTLAHESKQQFVQEGFVRVDGTVPAELCNRALRVINYYLAQPECAAAQPDKDGRLSLPGHIAADPDVMALFYQSPLVSYVQQLLGVNQIQAVNVAQVELRYSELGEPHKLSGCRWYIDGFTQQAPSPYTCLVAVPLSDQSLPWTGNFVAFPGSHMTLQEHVREAVGSRNLDLRNELDLSKPDLGEPVQVIMQPGSAIIAHQKLAMRGGPNYGPHIRYMVYFRVQHVDHAQLQQFVLDSPWVEFEGLADLVN